MKNILKILEGISGYLFNYASAEDPCNYFATCEMYHPAAVTMEMLNNYITFRIRVYFHTILKCQGYDV